MSEYLPLSAFRQDLLPGPCRCCAWWQTAGIARVDPRTASTVRTNWTISVEAEWGSPGLVRTPQDQARPQAGTMCAGALHFAPAAGVPRLRDIITPGLPSDAVLLFCLRTDPSPDPFQARRLLREALKELKGRRVREVFAVATVADGAPYEERCEFFSQDFLVADGFEHLMSWGDVCLMRADLRGLLSLLAPIEVAWRRLLRNDPAPSPAAWSSRGTP